MKKFAEAAVDLKLKPLDDAKSSAVTKAQAKTAANEADLRIEVIDGVTVSANGNQVVIKGGIGVGTPNSTLLSLRKT